MSKKIVILTKNPMFPSNGVIPHDTVPCKSQKNALNYGFSLIESLFAIAIGVMVAIAVTGVSIQGLKDVRSLKRTERLHADAQFLSDEIGSAMRQAIRIEVPSSTELRAILPSKTMVFQKTGDTITLDDNGDIYDIISDSTLVNELKFEGFPRSVRYAFTLRSASGAETFSATTTAAQRNSP